MRKLLIYVCCGAVLVGCTAPVPTQENPFPSTVRDAATATWTDEETGCQYLVSNGYGRAAMAPRYNTDGVTVMGCRDASAAVHGGKN